MVEVTPTYFPLKRDVLKSWYAGTFAYSFNSISSFSSQLLEVISRLALIAYAIS